MSHSSLTIGDIEFKEKPPKEVLDEICSILELEPLQFVDDPHYLHPNEFNGSYTCYVNPKNEMRFVSLNYTSHVAPEDLDKLDKFKQYYKLAVVSWYYIDEDDYQYYYNSEDKDKA